MLQLMKLSYRRGRRWIIKDFNLEIPDCGLTIIDKPSGFGKTTLAKLIAEEIRPTSGKITSDFKKVVQLKQKPKLIEEATVRESLDLTGFASQSLVEKLELKPYLDTKISALSEGYRQRVAFARAVLQVGELYIFDEPFQFQDEKGREVMGEYIDCLAKDRACLLLVHDCHQPLESVSFDRVKTTSQPRVDIYPKRQRNFACFFLLSLLFAFLLPSSAHRVTDFGFHLPFELEEARVLDTDLVGSDLEKVAEEVAEVKVEDLVFNGHSYFVNPRSELVLATDLYYRLLPSTYSLNSYYLTERLAGKIKANLLSNSYLTENDFPSLTLNLSENTLKFGGYLPDSYSDAIYIRSERALGLMSKVYPVENISLSEGRKPEKIDEIVVGKEGLKFFESQNQSAELGSTVVLDGMNLTVVGHGEGYFLSDAADIPLDPYQVKLIGTAELAKVLSLIEGAIAIVDEDRDCWRRVQLPIASDLPHYDSDDPRNFALNSIVLVLLILTLSGGAIFILIGSHSAHNCRALIESGIKPTKTFRTSLLQLSPGLVFLLFSSGLLGTIVYAFRSTAATFLGNLLILMIGMLAETLLMALIASLTLWLRCRRLS